MTLSGMLHQLREARIHAQKKIATIDGALAALIGLESPQPDNIPDNLMAQTKSSGGAANQAG